MENQISVGDDSVRGITAGDPEVQNTSKSDERIEAPKKMNKAQLSQNEKQNMQSM